MEPTIRKRTCWLDKDFDDLIDLKNEKGLDDRMVKKLWLSWAKLRSYWDWALLKFSLDSTDLVCLKFIGCI